MAAPSPALARAQDNTSTNDEAPSTANTRGLEVQQTHLDSDSPADKVKRLATLTAKLALSGYALTQLADGPYLVSRWDRTRELPSLSEVDAFLVQIGGAA
ncbi:hypothetical protein [Rhizobacter fulvus]